ncbi:hypothetical protein HDU86_004950 [Geranomyces michiganensis]|nr:hypothetical protein HDU86_004950 [Geranomyces michiganensis]
MMKAVGRAGVHQSATVPKAPPLDLSTVDPPFAPETLPLDEGDVKRHFGLPHCPVFRPTDEEFKDPMRYIESIRAEGEASGICKIIPPSTWKPEFAMDTETFWFRPRIMRLNSMEGGSRAILNYLDQLQKFHSQQGTHFTRIPILNKEPINLFELKKEVSRRGGYDAVTRGKLWASVGRAIGLGGKTCTSLSHSVKSAYLRWIHPYEVFMAKHSSGSRGGSPTPGTPTSDGKGPSTRSKRKSGKPPVVAAASPQPSETSSSILPSDYLPKPGLELCEICAGGENDEQMLLCDGCNRGYHLYCFDPPMVAIPNTDWFCPDCLRGSGHDYGFEEGELRSLSSFQKVANNFKQNHFRRRLNKQPGERVTVTEKQVEQEFWRLVESTYDDVEVEYGADLHSTQHGSGFPVPEKQPTSPYSTCGWNLNNMPVLPDSLFCNIRNDISGMMIPWLYVGMVFSTFCWHTEDHYTYSINYMHWGETKTWYGIPASYADRFEETMKKRVPELFEGNPDLLFHLTTMLSPAVLMKNNVKVVGCDQRPGEFVVTFPRAYHAGFNQGFNFAEAVNFALPNWLPYGLDCVGRYQFHQKQPVFSHDELIVATSKRNIDVRAAVWLKPALEHLRDRELAARKKVRDRHPGITEIVENLEINQEEEDQCLVCHVYCYMSALKCTQCAKGKMVCFDHEDELCECETPRLTMTLRYADSDLQGFVDQVAKIASQPKEWKDKYDTLLSQHRRPPLKDLQRLLAASEKIPYVIDEAVLLGDFVQKAINWVDRANKVLVKRKRGGGRRVSGLADDFEEANGDRTLDNIELLLSEAEALSFDAPEMKLMEALAGSVYEFRAQARTVLDAPDVTSDKVHETLDLARALDVTVPELEMLEDKLEQLEWIEHAQSTLSLTEITSHEDILELIDGGRALGIKSDHPLMHRLKQARLEGDQWRIVAAALLKQRRIDWKELKEVEESGRRVPVVSELWEKIEGYVKKADNWMARAKEALETREDGSRLPTPLLFELVAEIEDFPVHLKEIQTLRDDAKKVTRWTESARRAIRSWHDKPLAELVAELEVNVSACTKPHAEQAADVFCVCRTSTDEGLMIECEICHCWYHSACVKVSKKAAKTQKRYICPVCDVWTDKPVVKRVGIRQFQDLVKESDDIERWKVDEVDGLKHMVDMVEGWSARVKAAIDPESGTSVTELKNYLRCAEGLHVFVESEIKDLRQRLRELCAKPEPSPPPTPDPIPIQQTPESLSKPQLFCLCRRPHREEDGEMIGCDTCSEWYHFNCVNLDVTTAQGIDTYVCPVCVARQNNPASSITPADSRTSSELVVNLPHITNGHVNNDNLLLPSDAKPKPKRRKPAQETPGGEEKKRKKGSDDVAADGEEKKRSHKRRKDGPPAAGTATSAAAALAMLNQPPRHSEHPHSMGTATTHPGHMVINERDDGVRQPKKMADGTERKRKASLAFPKGDGTLASNGADPAAPPPKKERKKYTRKVPLGAPPQSSHPAAGPAPGYTGGHPHSEYAQQQYAPSPPPAAGRHYDQPGSYSPYNTLPPPFQQQQSQHYAQPDQPSAMQNEFLPSLSHLLSQLQHQQHHQEQYLQHDAHPNLASALPLPPAPDGNGALSAHSGNNTAPASPGYPPRQAFQPQQPARHHTHYQQQDAGRGGYYWTHQSQQPQQPQYHPHQEQNYYWEQQQQQQHQQQMRMQQQHQHHHQQQHQQHRQQGQLHALADAAAMAALPPTPGNGGDISGDEDFGAAFGFAA